MIVLRFPHEKRLLSSPFWIKNCCQVCTMWNTELFNIIKKIGGPWLIKAHFKLISILKKLNILGEFLGYLHIIRYALCLSFWALLVHSCQQYVTLHHVSKSISCYKAMCWYAHCFHDCIYITPILLLWDLSYYDKIDVRSVKRVLQTISLKKRSTIDAELWPVLGLVKKGRGLTGNF